ncbi:DUF4258 domain-containing protein [bacterium]|nr:DUF4258 domain-containing protein [bacterium]
MRHRRIDESDVVDAVKNPDSIEVQGGRRIAVKQAGAHDLRVVYIEEGAEIVVLTALRKRRRR